MNTFSPSRFKGKTYEATYLGWIDFFEQLANHDGRATVKGAPFSWTCFIQYMGHIPVEPVNWFPEDQYIRNFSLTGYGYEQSRRLVEMASVARPELAHALYLWDTDWAHRENAKKRALHADQRSKEFVVTCNASFFRPEVLEYLQALQAWKPSADFYSRPLIICPCAADKPYPASLHQAIQKVCPDAYLIVATGVLGLVPADLWPIAPNYDAGIPYNERVYDITRAFFSRLHHEVVGLQIKVIVYSDFLQYQICRALRDSFQPYISVFGANRMEGYMDLMNETNLRRLEVVYGNVHLKWRS